MKRTKLLRRTPLKSRQKPLKKTRLKTVSKGKESYMARYREMRKSDPTQLEAHHPFGRQKDALLAYVLVSPERHRDIHDNGKLAYAQGWLQDPYYGRPLKPNHPRPWSVHEEYRWSEKYKRQQSK